MTTALAVGGRPLPPPPDRALDGNPEITCWCPECLCTVVRPRNGCCMWCGHKTKEAR